MTESFRAAAVTPWGCPADENGSIESSTQYVWLGALMAELSSPAILIHVVLVAISVAVWLLLLLVLHHRIVRKETALLQAINLSQEAAYARILEDLKALCAEDEHASEDESAAVVNAQHESAAVVNAQHESVAKATDKALVAIRREIEGLAKLVQMQSGPKTTALYAAPTGKKLHRNTSCSHLANTKSVLALAVNAELMDWMVHNSQAVCCICNAQKEPAPRAGALV